MKIWNRYQHLLYFILPIAAIATVIGYGRMHPDIPTTCGNGKLDPGEECDDGNNVDHDGCSAKCTIELLKTSADLVFIFTPNDNLRPDTGPKGKVQLWGYYTGHSGDNELCQMTPSDNSYACTLSGLSGKRFLEFNVHFTKATSGTGECWIFDRSMNRPCGGGGKYLGTIKVLKNGVDISNKLKFRSNGLCDGPNSVDCRRPFDNAFFDPVP